MSESRAALVKAFRHAVDGEKRFGHRADEHIDAELTSRWNAVIDLIEELCPKTPPKKKQPRRAR